MALDRISELPRAGRRPRKEEVITLADRARDARQWELAAQLYKKALDRNPYNAPIWVQYGHALKEWGELRDPEQLAQAEAAYRRALSLDAGTADTYLQLGHVLKLQGRPEEAKACYLRAFALDPAKRYPLDELRGLGWSEQEISELVGVLGADGAEQRPAGADRHKQPAEHGQHNPADESLTESYPRGPIESFRVNDSDVLCAENEEIGVISQSKLFDATWYVEKYKDVLDPGDDPLCDYVRRGAAEGRDPNRLFDSDWYLATNPDVAAAAINPLVHFIVNGAAEGRAPHPLFDTPWYVKVNPDVVASGMNPLAHYLLFGASEGCVPGPTLDGALVEAKLQFREQALRELSAFLEAGESLRLPAASDPEVSILLVLFNEAELTLRCLRSLIDTVDVAAEVIIVDNASSDATLQLLSHLEGARIIHNSENRHFLRAVNQGSAEAQGEALLLLNNDVMLKSGAVEAALETLYKATDIGAVGGKLILPDGRLQEAGSIVWSSGACTGYGRGQNPNAPEYQFQRDVDYCSGAFLLVRRDVFERLGRFDSAFAPAYYEETDFCMRLRRAGYRVVYDPRVEVVHYEFGSSSRSEQAMALMQRNHKLFIERHRKALKADHLPPGTSALTARMSNSRCTRLLLIDDRVPFPSYGAGHPRALSILKTLHKEGYFISYYPMDAEVAWSEVYAGFPHEIEFIVGPSRSGLSAFLEERAGYYQIIIVSRPHNMARFLEERQTRPDLYDGINIIYDAEAVFIEREAKRLELAGRPLSPADQDAQLHAELDLARAAHAIVAVSVRDADVFREAGIHNVHTVGHSLLPQPFAADFDNRRDLLFVGALNDDAVPNVDSLFWFIDEVMPLLDRSLGDRYRLLVAGRAGANRLRGFVNARVDILGQVPDLAEYYRQARVFVAPTRFAAGVPHKLHETAAHGLPAVATSLLATQLGWRAETELLVGDSPQEFANQCARLYTDPALWQRIREAALVKVAADCNPEVFDKALTAVLGSLGVATTVTKSVPIGERAYAATTPSLQPQTPDLSLIMPTFNRGSLMESSAVKYLRCCENTRAELIVIDDGSTDDTPERLRLLSRTHANLIWDRVDNSGPARARNLAASMARGKILVFVGDDVQPTDEYFLAFHLSAHKRFPKQNEAVLGKITWPNTQAFPVNLVMRHIQGDGGQQFPYKKMQPYSWYDWKYFFSSNVSVKRLLVRDWMKEGYDPSFYYAAFEDGEFALRMTKRYRSEGADFRIFYVPAAALVHFHPYTVESFLQRQVSVGMMANRLLELHPDHATDIGLDDLISRLNDIQDSSSLPIERYLSVFEGIKSWAIVLEHHYGLGSQNWHAEVLLTIFELAYFEGYIRSKTDPRLNYGSACRFVLEQVQSSLNKAIFTELVGNVTPFALV